MSDLPPYPLNGDLHTAILEALMEELRLQFPGAFTEDDNFRLVIPSGCTLGTAYVDLDVSSLAEAALGISAASPESGSITLKTNQSLTPLEEELVEDSSNASRAAMGPLPHVATEAELSAAVTLAQVVAWVVVNDGECIGDHPRILAAARSALSKALGGNS